MGTYRKNIYILIFSILIYFILIFLYNNFFIKANKVEVFILKKDVSRGEEIKIEDFEILKISNELLNTKFENLKKEDIIGKISSDFLLNGQILKKEFLLDKDKYIKSNINTEIISISIKNPEDIASYQVIRGSVVNIYYTGKTSQLKDFIKIYDFENITSSGDNDSYTTIKLLENVKILGIFDKYGKNIVLEQKNIVKDDLVIDTVMIETNKENIMRINNLKNYGVFNISVLK